MIMTTPVDNPHGASGNKVVEDSTTQVIKELFISKYRNTNNLKKSME